MRYLPMESVRDLATRRCGQKVILARHLITDHPNEVEAKVKELVQGVTRFWKDEADHVLGQAWGDDTHGLQVTTETSDAGSSAFQTVWTEIRVDARWNPYAVGRLVLADGPADGKELEVPPRFELQYGVTPVLTVAVPLVEERRSHPFPAPPMFQDVVATKTVRYMAAGWDAETGRWVLTPDGAAPSWS